MEDNTNTEPPVEISYFEKRCLSIGLTPERNKFSVVRHPAMKNSPVDEFPLLCEDKKTGDILIPLYDIEGKPCTRYEDNPGKLQNGKEKPLEVRRFHPDTHAKMCKAAEKAGKNEPGKYQNPKGAKTIPWLSPNIIEARRNATHIDTIVITEGYIKAISGWLNGLYIVGLSGIQNIKDRDTATMHPDILTCIKECKVKNIVLLYDGDCNNISLKALEAGKDLYTRPHGFFVSARNIVELLKDHRKENEFDIYFAHVNSDNLDGKPKGLDDLFETYPEEFTDIVKELTSFSKHKHVYFQKFNITHGLSKVSQHLHISNHEQFHTAHNQLIGEKEFVFNGTKFKYDKEKNEIKIVIPGAAKNYVRVGDNYFENVMIPDKNGVLEEHLHRRLQSTIITDHGKNFVQHITKCKAFCSVPDHIYHQRIIKGCYNRYKPFVHEASEDSKDCPEILNFLTHIFKEQLELGLDYLQLLYQKPTQKLPILCLVSKENNTGKSTLGFLMKEIFTSNMITIGNSDLESDFNGNWADKLIIACEETMVDKKRTIEKIKALSMGNKISMNMKGIDQIEIDFFGKFLFFSNNEDNFIIANEYDERFWVRRVPKYEGKERSNLLELMKEEIPAFLAYLNSRTMHSQGGGRMYFKPEELRTDALKKLIEGNKSAAEREIIQFIRGMMLEHGFTTLKYNLKYIAKEVLRGRYETNYIERILKERIKIKTSERGQRFKYPVVINSHNPDGKGGYNETLVLNEGNGRPYTFTAEMFCTKEEISTIELCHEAKYLGQEIEQAELQFKDDIITNRVNDGAF